MVKIINMDLKEFISKTLISISEGVKESNKINKMFEIRPKDQVVNFDIAVEIAEEKESGKGGGLKIKVVEGNLSASQRSKESNISRINFTVGVGTKIS